MTLSCDELEPRDALSAPPADLGGGVVRVRPLPLFDVVAIPGWAGPLNVAESGGRVYVGPGAGGAPREVIFDQATGARLADFFAGDPADRTGFAPPVPADPPAAPAGRAHASAGTPGGFFVFVDDERDGPPAETAAAVAALPGLFPGVPLAFGTDRPDAPPGSYATLVLGASLDWFAGGTLGLCLGSEQAVGPTQMAPQAVYVRAGLTPAYTLVVAAHELGHLLGLQHTTAPLSLMHNPPAAVATFSPAELDDIRHALSGA